MADLTFEQGIIVGMLYLGENIPRVLAMVKHPPKGSVNEMLERNFSAVAQKLGSQPIHGFPNGIPKEALETADALVNELTIRGNLRFSDIVMGVVR